MQSCIDGIGVSCPYCFATTWSNEVPASTSEPCVCFGFACVRNTAADRKWQSRTPPQPKAAGKRGLVLYEAKRYGEAEVFLTNAVRQDPKNPYNYLNLGVVLRAQKKYKLAVDAPGKYMEPSSKGDGLRKNPQNGNKSLKKKPE